MALNLTIFVTEYQVTEPIHRTPEGLLIEIAGKNSVLYFFTFTWDGEKLIEGNI